MPLPEANNPENSLLLTSIFFHHRCSSFAVVAYVGWMGRAHQPVRTPAPVRLVSSTPEWLSRAGGRAAEARQKQHRVVVAQASPD